MSRSGYVEDCENFNCWRGAVERAIKGKRGQKFLRELAEAMDAMTEKILIAGELINDCGECCAIGAVVKARGIEVDKIDYFDAGQVGEAVGIARAMAAEIEYMNDEYFCRDTPEDRWTRMRQWVNYQIGKSKEAP